MSDFSSSIISCVVGLISLPIVFFFQWSNILCDHLLYFSITCSHCYPKPGANTDHSRRRGDGMSPIQPTLRSKYGAVMAINLLEMARAAGQGRCLCSGPAPGAAAHGAAPREAQPLAYTQWHAWDGTSPLEALPVGDLSHRGNCRRTMGY